MTALSGPVDFSNAVGVDAELNPLVAPFQMSLASHVDDEKKSMSIFPRSFYGRRRLVVVTVCVIMAACMVRMLSHGKLSNMMSSQQDYFVMCNGRLNQSHVRGPIGTVQQDYKRTRLVLGAGTSHAGNMVKSCSCYLHK